MYKTLNVVFLGDSNVGKTSIIRRLTGRNVENTETTIGAEFSILHFPGNEEFSTPNYRCDLWDTAGQERYGAIVSSYIRNGDIFVIVFDCTNVYSWNHIQEWMDKAVNARPESIIILVGNKHDNIETHGIVTTKDILDLVIRNKCLYIEVSAKTGLHMDDFKDLLFVQMLSVYPNVEKRRQLIRQNAVDIRMASKSARYCSCIVI